jgi:phosphatidate cytidylyltransferase
MKLPLATDTLWLVGGTYALLAAASVISAALRRWKDPERKNPVLRNLVSRVRAWWIMVATFTVALAVGRIGTLVLFALISFLALREFITLTPTRRGDHQAIFLSFFLALPLQYVLIGIGGYGFFAIFIPVYVFALFSIRAAAAGDTTDFLARIGEQQWGLMVCVYFVSYVPALLTLKIPGFEGRNANLLFFLVAVVQLSDVLQYIWGKSFGRRPIAPTLSPNKTLEGFVGGAVCATAIGAGLWWATPFAPWQAALLAAAITLFGFFGGLVMSAIKRDRGVKDFSDMIAGHGGILDRIDSLCFAAPLFFHLVRQFFAH